MVNDELGNYVYPTDVLDNRNVTVASTYGGILTKDGGYYIEKDGVYTKVGQSMPLNVSLYE